MIRASLAIIEKEGKVLGVSRKHDPTDFGFPGGKVDLNETFEQALIREVYEETGLTIQSHKLLYEECLENHIQVFIVYPQHFELNSRESGMLEWKSPDYFSTSGSFRVKNSVYIEKWKNQR